MRKSLRDVQQLDTQLAENKQAISDLETEHERNMAGFGQEMVDLLKEVKKDNAMLRPKVRSGRATQEEKKKYQGNQNVLEQILQHLDGDDALFVRLLSEELDRAGLEIQRMDGELITVSAKKERLFSDVSSSHSHRPAIAWGKESRVLNGYPDGTFQPDRTVNRAEFLKIVLGAQGVNVSSASDPTGFRDIDEDAWYAPYVRYAKKQGIVQGYPDGSFRPEQAVNFAEALKMAYVALGVSGDASRGGEWYLPYLNHAKRRRVLFSNNVDVGTGMSRKDVVWIVWKLIEGNMAAEAPVLQHVDITSDSCNIKGNISSKDEKIYHVPGCGSYSRTQINEAAGERWFCSEQEARDAGWRKAENC